MTLVITQGWALIIKGGPFVWLLIILAFLGSILIIERFLAISTYRRQLVIIRQELWPLIKQGQLKEAIDYCENHPFWASDIIKSGILNLDYNKNIWQNLWQQMATATFNRMRVLVRIVGLISSLAPLLGIIATLVSLSVVYHAAYMRANALNPLALGDMASGIWQALIASTLGMIIGVILGVFHSWLMSSIEDIEDDFNAFMVHTLGVMTHEAQGD